MKPLTRKEMLLNAAANGTLDNFEPATREEVFTKEAFANAGGGVTSWNDLTDKPFGEEVNTVETVVYNHTFADGEEIPTYYHAECDSDIANETIALIIDGNRYELGKIIPDAGPILVGDSGTSVSMVYYYPNDLTISRLPSTTKNIQVIKITEETTLTPLPSKYLPEHLQFGEEVIENVIVAPVSVTLEQTPNPMGMGSDFLLGKAEIEANTEFVVGNTYSVVIGEKKFTVVCHELTSTLGENGFDQSGYFGDYDFGIYVSTLQNGDTGEHETEMTVGLPIVDAVAGVYDVSITEVSTSITPLDPKYLPVMTVNAVGVNNSPHAECDKTYEEIITHYNAGGTVRILLTIGPNKYVVMNVMKTTNSRIYFGGFDTSIYAASDAEAGSLQLLMYWTVEMSSDYCLYASHSLLTS